MTRHLTAVRRASAGLLAVALSALLVATPAAQVLDRTQVLTVSNTAVPLSASILVDPQRRGATACVFSVETDDIRLRYDGTDPTASVGHLYAADSAFQISGTAALDALRLIRVTMDATVTVTCSYGPAEPALRAAGGGGGGGAGAAGEVSISQSGNDNAVDVLTLPALPTGTNDIGNVNLEIGGTVIDTNTGVDGAQTIRVTEATDSPIAVSLAIIDNVVFGAGTEAAALRVTLPTDGTGVVGITGAALTALQLIDNAISGAGFNITQLGGAAVPIGAGTEATAVRVTLPTNGTGIVGLAAGTANVGNIDVQVAVGGTPTVQTGATEGSFTGAHTILIDPATDAAVVYAGACTPGSLISAATVNETEIKDTAGYLDWLYVTSLDATPVYLKIYNVADGAGLDETDTPTLRIMVPANSTASLGAGATSSIPAGVTFSTAMAFRLTTGLADNDTNAVSANEVLVNWCYR